MGEEVKEKVDILAKKDAEINMLKQQLAVVSNNFNKVVTDKTMESIKVMNDIISNHAVYDIHCEGFIGFLCKEIAEIITNDAGNNTDKKDAETKG